MKRYLLVVALLACSKSAAVPPPTSFLLTAGPTLQPSQDVQARLVAGTPPQETATLNCGGASVDVSFNRRLDPQTSGQYLDAVRVRIADPRGGRVTAAMVGSPRNAGSAEKPEMEVTIVMGVGRGDPTTGALFVCSFSLHATRTPAVQLTSSTNA